MTLLVNCATHGHTSYFFHPLSQRNRHRVQNLWQGHHSTYITPLPSSKKLMGIIYVYFKRVFFPSSFADSFLTKAEKAPPSLWIISWDGLLWFLASCKNWVTLYPPLLSDTHSSLFKSATQPLRPPAPPYPPKPTTVLQTRQSSCPGLLSPNGFGISAQ